MGNRLLVLVLVVAPALSLCLVLTRRAAYHVCYVIPGACATLTGPPSGGHISGLAEHADDGPVPPAV
ncbi:hypothetical protein ACPCAC_04530 [Streptomyces lavendulocolor]|uniref:hypothetical protein n=1 Tax=Streptomyces lavendulocolor TaxID=67316 RepID=UPI003C2B69C7